MLFEPKNFDIDRIGGIMYVESLYYELILLKLALMSDHVIFCQSNFAQYDKNILND